MKNIVIINDNNNAFKKRKKTFVSSKDDKSLSIDIDQIRMPGKIGYKHISPKPDLYVSNINRNFGRTILDNYTTRNFSENKYAEDS